MTHQQLIDRFGRIHNNLRISVTDRCNIRCFYCMPAENVEFMPRTELLTFEEIHFVVGIAAKLGINRLRLTGGEPLVRKDLPELIKMLSAIPEIQDIGITTNGVLLEELAAPLKAAGLKKLNISLDALNADVFQRVTRRNCFAAVMKGIQAARDAGFSPIKINAVAIRNLTEDQILPFAELALKTDTIVRFIEFMPLDADAAWQKNKVLFAEEILQIIQQEYGPLTAVQTNSLHAPSQDYHFAKGAGIIGLIASVSQPFCQSCNRFRLTADGKLRNCLFSLEETDIRNLVRTAKPNTNLIAQKMLECVAEKQVGHQINQANFIQPDRPMYSIGG